MKTQLVNRTYLVFILAIVLMGYSTQDSSGQTITATSDPQPLTEANLHESVVTLTLNGAKYARSTFDIRDAVTVSGIDGVTVGTWDVDRVSDTEVTVELTFDGTDFDTDANLTFTVGAGAITGYSGNALTAQIPVTGLEESLIASTEFPLTETNLHGSVVTLTLSGRTYDDWIGDWDVTVSGIDGVTFRRWSGINRVSDTEVTVELAFDGDFDTDATLTFTVDADAIAGNYTGSPLTAQVPITAMEESMVASTEFPLTEANLHGSVVTLTLSGRTYDDWIGSDVTVFGIDGIDFKRWDIHHVSDTEVTVELTFDSTDFDTDATLTFTVGAGAITGYGGNPLTAQIPVTAIENSNATVSISPLVVVSPDVGEELRFSLNIAGGENVAGYQATVSFNPTALRYLKSAYGNYLPADSFFADPIVRYWPSGVVTLTLTASTLAGVGNGDGTLATLTFEVKDFKASRLTLSQLYLVDSDGKLWEVATQNGKVILPPEPQDIIFGDINRDGVVDIQDLAIVGARFGERGQNSADLNGDNQVDIVDLVLVAAAFTDEAAAPSVYPQTLELLTAADVRQWLTQTQGLHLTDPTFQRGIHFLEQLLTALTPKETTLLPNYPNPFNPETWIPYRLAEDAFVTLTIYDGEGQVVRTLDVGHRVAAFYESRSKAIYWDGRNEVGEQVGSGVYFYHLSAGDYSATRRMLILK